MRLALYLPDTKRGCAAHLFAEADAELRIPVAAGARSMNVVTAGAMALAEALRQTEGWPTA